MSPDDLPEATARPLRPIMQLRSRLPSDANSPFSTLQDAQRALADVQERLDELAKRLIGEPPRFVAPESPSVPTTGGLLGITGLVGRNLRARAEHMSKVLELIEQGLG